MRLALMSLLVMGILAGGCYDRSQETPADVHLKNYLKLRKKNPESALLELMKHANIAFKGHPRASEWARLAARMDRAEGGSLPDMLSLNRLFLDMANDNSAAVEQIRDMEDEVRLWEELARELEAEGTDPDTFFIGFRLKLKR